MLGKSCSACWRVTPASEGDGKETLVAFTGGTSPSPGGRDVPVATFVVGISFRPPTDGLFFRVCRKAPTAKSKPTPTVARFRGRKSAERFCQKPWECSCEWEGCSRTSLG